MDPDFKILIKQKLQKISEFFAAIKFKLFLIFYSQRKCFYVTG